MPDLVQVEFTMPCPPYNPGDRAGFTDDEARILVESKRAGFYTDPDRQTAYLGGVEQDLSPPDDLNRETHNRTVAEVKELAGATRDLDYLADLLEGEAHHPSHEGGRAGAIKIIEDRIESLVEEAMDEAEELEEPSEKAEPREEEEEE